MIRELREEVERLRKLLENQGISPDDEDHKMAELEALRARLEEQDNYIQELQVWCSSVGRTLLLLCVCVGVCVCVCVCVCV